MQGSREARKQAEYEYKQGKEDHRAELAQLDHEIRNAAEKIEMEERCVS